MEVLLQVVARVAPRLTANIDPPLTNHPNKAIDL